MIYNSYLSYAKDLSWLDACLPLCMTAFESLSSKKQLTVLGKSCILHPVHQLMHPCWHCSAMLPLFWKYNYVRWEMQMRHLLHLACHSFTIPRSASVYLFFLLSVYLLQERGTVASVRGKRGWIVFGLFARAWIDNAVFCGRLLMDQVHVQDHDVSLYAYACARWYVSLYLLGRTSVKRHFHGS